MLFREHFRQPIVDYINPECLVSKAVETRCFGGASETRVTSGLTS